MENRTLFLDVESGNWYYEYCTKWKWLGSGNTKKCKRWNKEWYDTKNKETARKIRDIGFVLSKDRI